MRSGWVKGATPGSGGVDVVTPRLGWTDRWSDRKQRLAFKVEVKGKELLLID